MTVKILERDAVISDDGVYRYLLRRVWDYGKPRALVIMLNPSTATAEVDDATIRALVRLLDALSYGSYEVVNIFAFRATDPRAIATVDDPVGPYNEDVIRSAIGRCDIVICAWGAHSAVGDRAIPVINEIRSRRPAAYCFGLTKSGAPKHPLYIKSGTQLEVLY
jgi:hypothetical protein